MIARYVECDSPSCDARVALPALAPTPIMPPDGWLLTGLPHYEEWYEPAQERHFCSPECVRYYLTLTAENRAAAQAEVAS